MAFKNLIAFGAGELTPELYERGNLDKFRTGLARLRNATVTKMGGLRSRAGTRKLFTPKSGLAAKYLYLQSKNQLLEFTTSNIRVHSNFDPDYFTFSSILDVNMSSYSAMTNVQNIHFTFGNKYLFIFNETHEAVRVDIDKIFSDPLNATSLMRNNIRPFAPSQWYINPPTVVTYAASGGGFTGYDIDYSISYVYEGVETFNSDINQTLKKPVATGEYNSVTVTITKASLAGQPFPDEVRIYQRPRNGGSFFFVGNAFPVETGTTVTYSFRDAGVQLVANDQPPEYVSQFSADVKTATVDPGVYIYPPKSKTGLVYQDRLIFSGTRLSNRVFGTRTGSTAMTRDFPLQADSAVSFKIGSDGGLKIQRFFDGRGLLMFTTVGVYETPTDLLTPDSAYGIKRGPYVATDKVEPLLLGGFVTIYDKRLRSVIGLTPSGSDQGYAYSEFSIYSAHLIKGREIVSWALEDSETQVLWIVLDDGKVLSFSFQDEQQLRSWAWHDFKDGLAEEVFVMKVQDGKDVVSFQVNRNGTRYVETLTDRNADFIDFVGSDSSVVYKENTMVQQAIINATIAPVTPSVWDGPLTVTPDFGGFGEAVGAILRVYTDAPWEFVDLTVTANTLGVLTVTPSAEYPSTMSVVHITQGMWTVFKTLTGLSHLEDQKVSVRVDGFTHASPLNTQDESLEEYTVTGGQITLAGDVIGAVISVGLPIVTDIKTLEVDTVEQSPTKLEGQIVNKLWLSYFESLFFFAGSELPEDDTIAGMDSQEFQVEPDDGISNNVPMLPMSERLEMQIQGDWKVKGSVSLRNVDPQPVALRAIIPDTEVIRN